MTNTTTAITTFDFCLKLLHIKSPGTQKWTLATVGGGIFTGQMISQLLNQQRQSTTWVSFSSRVLPYGRFKTHSQECPVLRLPFNLFI